jgi:multidrug transporter EmrE-like cation transporter
MLGYVLAQAGSIVLNTSLSKVLALQSDGPSFLWWMILYLLVALFNFRVATLAAASLDLTVYVPVFAFVKLLLNCIAGLAIWEDWRTINHWLAYPALYLLMGCGVYLLSEFDLTQSVAMRQMIPEAIYETAEESDPSRERWIASSSYHQATTTTGDALGTLLDIWAMGWEMDPDDHGDAFQEFLEAGLQSGVISTSNLIELSTTQQAEALELRRALHQQMQGCGHPSSSVIFPGVARWIRKRCSLEPGVVGRIRTIELAPGDMLPASYRDFPSDISSPWRMVPDKGLQAEISGDDLAASGPLPTSTKAP